ncbi:MAG: hypothetical protein ACLSX5_13000 [Lachnospiraceae bacterium]
MFRSILSYLIIPFYTLLFVRQTDWFSTNFSVIGSLEEQKNFFSAWAILLSVTLYPMLFPLIDKAPFIQKHSHFPSRKTICFILLNQSLLFLTAAVILPYAPSRLPLQARLHVVCALLSGLSLFTCLVLLIHGYYRTKPSVFRTPVLILWGSFVISMLLLLLCGIVNSALEILVTITACVLSRQMYQKVFGR